MLEEIPSEDYRNYLSPLCILHTEGDTQQAVTGRWPLVEHNLTGSLPGQLALALELS